jgi:hypothetical protein
MCFLPQLHQAVKMRIGHIEYVPHMISFCIAGLDGIPPLSQTNTSNFAQFKDDNNSLISAMNARRIAIFRIHTERDTIAADESYNLSESGLKKGDSVKMSIECIPSCELPEIS